MDIKTHRWGRINEREKRNRKWLWPSLCQLLTSHRLYSELFFTVWTHLQSVNRVIGWIFAELMIIYIWEIERSRVFSMSWSFKCNKKHGNLRLNVNICTSRSISLNPSALKIYCSKASPFSYYLSRFICTISRN